MINTLHYRRFLLFFILSCGLSSAASGQVLLPANYTTPNQAQIDGFVDAHVKGLTGADPTLWGPHRTSLISVAETKQTTPQFFEVYAASLNRGLGKLTKDKDARVRLNAAIIVARVAAKAANGGLAPITQDLLKDTNDGVVMWGMQSAKYVVPALLASTDSKDAIAIGKLVIAAVKNRDLLINISEETSRSILEEAFRTILLDPNLGERNAVASNMISAISPADLGAYLPTVQDFLEYRVKSYDDPMLPPKQPPLDKSILTFFSKDSIWHAQSAAVQAKSRSLIVGLIKGATKQFAATSSPEFLEVIKNSGQAIQVIGVFDSNPKLSAAGKALNGIPTGASADDITTLTGNIEAALH